MRLRPIHFALAVSATAGAAITAFTVAARTDETALEISCVNAAWPTIPAHCIDGRVPPEVRFVPLGRGSGETFSTLRTTGNTRFATAFGSDSDG